MDLNSALNFKLKILKIYFIVCYEYICMFLSGVKVKHFFRRDGWTHFLFQIWYFVLNFLLNKQGLISKKIKNIAS